MWVGDLGYGCGLDVPAHPSATILWPRVTIYYEKCFFLSFFLSFFLFFFLSSFLSFSLIDCRFMRVICPCQPVYFFLSLSLIDRLMSYFFYSFDSFSFFPSWLFSSYLKGFFPKFVLIFLRTCVSSSFNLWMLWSRDLHSVVRNDTSSCSMSVFCRTWVMHATLRIKFPFTRSLLRAFCSIFAEKKRYNLFGTVFEVGDVFCFTDFLSGFFI